MKENKSITREKTMLDLRDKIFVSWLEQLRSEVSKARKLPEPLLINTLPVFYETLVRIASSNAPAYESTTLALEHGGERARLTHFDTQTIVHEYQLFRSVVFSAWNHAGVSLSLAEIAAANQTIDRALAESISGFVIVEERFREQFFSSLVHDMRTPLATASMAIEMISQSDNIHRIRAMANIAAKQHNLLNQMISDLLDTVVTVAGAERSLDLKPMEMRAIAQEVADSAQLAHSRVVIVDGNAVEGIWSASAIRRALENLVNNAIKYGTQDTDVRIILSQFHGRCIVAVENVGPPIPVEQQENIFQLFRRSEHATRNSAAGWGIGLPYVRSVAEQHGGSIGVESTDTKTIFLFDIPIDPRPLLLAKYNDTLTSKP
jgi:signal transduction histidine kinase